MLVNVLSPWSLKGHFFTYPIRAFGNHLKDIGISTRIYHVFRKRALRCDVLLVVGDYFRQAIAHDPSAVLEAILKYRQQAGALVWCDVTDSTGTPFFDVLPHVDLYAKNQLLKDRDSYTQEFYGLRQYAQYYHETRGIVDREQVRRRPAPRDELHKLAVSWNIGLGDYRTLAKWGRRFRVFWPAAHYHPSATPVDRPEGEVDVSFRASNFGRPTASFPREETRRQLAELAEAESYAIHYEGKLPYKEYVSESRRARVIPSPFGLGEICWRDFECFLAGAALLKPDMSHLETWPNYFDPDVTYVAHQWDFSDFQDKVKGMLESRETLTRIAQTGQKRYLDALSSGGGVAYSRHFGSLIERAVDNARTPT